MAYLFLILGLMMLFLEFFLPGGILAVAGVIAMGAAVIYIFLDGAPVYEVLFFLFLAIVGAIGVVKLALKLIKGSKKESSFYLDSDQEGYKASGFDANWIGKTAIAHTDLRPGGYIKLEGKKVPAISSTGFILKGTQVIILSGEGECVYVKIKE